MAAFCHFYRMTPNEVGQLSLHQLNGFLSYIQTYSEKANGDAPSPTPQGQGAFAISSTVSPDSKHKTTTQSFRNPDPRGHSIQ